MAFSTKIDLVRTGFNPDGKIYSTQFEVLDTEESSTYRLPIDNFLGIGVAWSSGPPTMEFTFDSIAKINDDTAQWVAWDGTGKINNAVTGFRVSNATGSDVTMTLTVRMGE